MAPMTGVVVKEWSVESIKAGTVDVKGKHILIVGGTSGLGRAIALEACKEGAVVTVVGRKLQDEDASVPNLTFVKADLSSMKAAKEIGETICADSVQSLDVILFTIGIIAKKEREVSVDDIEMDIAVSSFSRIVVLKYLTPRLSKEKKVRVFVMGFPGANNPAHLDDLNAEKGYEGGFGWQHMNTILVNEALVLDAVAKGGPDSKILYFGLNPGLIKTGIRDAVWKGSWFMEKVMGPFVEFMVSMFSHSPESYAKNMVPLLFAPELDEHNGSMFNPNAQPTLASGMFTKDPELASKIITDSETIIKEKAGV